MQGIKEVAMINLGKVSPPHLLMIVLLFLFAQRANAYSITQEFEAVNVGNTDLQIYFNPFDASLGTLTGVYLDFRSFSTVTADQFDCTVVNPLWCTARGFISMLFSPGDGPGVSLTTDNIHSFRQGDSTLFTVSHGTPGFWPHNLLILSSFTEVAPRLVASDWWRCEVNCSGDSYSYRDGTHTVRGSLTYVYVPVPATLALLALGLLALAMLRPGSALCGRR
jgi:hypothetical protein